ncbi:MAG: protein kinase [Gemmatimonadetes bacterium]|nr:protein kinase [Gemmatimonadota bacterium]
MEAPSVEAVRTAVGDHYEVDKLFGRGGMGAVYLGRHRTLGSKVAIKVLPVPAAEGSDELARFRREAKLAANLPHPHIVPVYEFDIKNELAFFIMPFVDGVSLAAYLEEHGRLELAEVRELLRQVGSGLSFAHDRGIIHRDIKPANILRERATGRWLITDFGIARPTSGGETITRTGMAVGTPAYMAPEQAVGAADIDGRADLYSLAAVACEALTGDRTDTLRDAEQLESTVRAARPDLPRRVLRILASPLALERERRPPSVTDWLEQLDATDPRHSAPGMASAAPRWSVRTIIAALTAVGVLFAVAVFMWQRQSGASPVDPVPTIAIVPFSVTGSIDRVDLASTLPKAFEDQLRWIPEYRVVATGALSQAIADRFGDAGGSADVLTDFVAERFGASEVLFGTVVVSESNRLHIRVQVRESTNTRAIRGAEATGPVDSLPRLIATLVTQTFAERLARERTGWSAALPKGLNAIRAYFEGDRLFRSAAYDQAIEQFDQVIAQDSTFAPAYFKRMLSEVSRARPTRATGAMRSALDAVQRYRDGLDPTTAKLLGAYELIVERGELERAHDALQAIVAQHPNAVDAWFMLGFLEFYLGPLFGTPPSQAEWALRQVHELDPGFAAAISQLALLAVLQQNQTGAQRYFREYLAIDSTSAWAELMRMSDSMLYGGVGAALAVRGSFASRPAAALEIIAMSGAKLGIQLADRLIARDAIDALVGRATTSFDRAVGFRLQMASAIGTGRLATADTLLHEARRHNVPQGEVDRWMVLTAVTGTAELGDATAQARAVERLETFGGDDPTGRWLVARWYRDRDSLRVHVAARSLSSLLADAAGSNPLVLSLSEDLAAFDSLAAGDTAAALRIWRHATERYNVERVPVGLVGSLWPLRLSWAQVAAANGDPEEVLAATAVFEQPVGYNDQVAWRIVLPLRAAAFRATGDPLGARNVDRALADALQDASGSAVSLRDSIMERLR